MTVPTGERPDHSGRRDRVRVGLADHGADRLLVTSSPNVRYLSGFSGSTGQVLLGADASDDRLVTDARYIERAAVEAPGLEVVRSRDPFAAALVAGDRAALAVEAEHLTWAAAERLRERAVEAGVEVVATTGLVEAVREVKDTHELAALDRACALTVAALEELLVERVVPGATERSLATWLERRFVDLGADGVAFSSIVAGGPNGAVPHHAPTDRPLTAGELVTIDCGAEVGGYHADCTRTVLVPSRGRGGSVDQLPGTLAEVHDLVARAQAAGRAVAVAGATGGDVDAAAREVIEAAGHGEAFVHGTGHGVGLEVHEAPAIARGSRDQLRVGTVLTVEPGVYLPGVGGVRIEDTVVVTDAGPPRVLTDLSRTRHA